MRIVAIANVGLFAGMLAVGIVAGACSAEATGSPRNPRTGTDDKDATSDDDDNTGIPDGPLPEGSAPRPSTTAGTSEIPACTSFVDASAAGGAGTSSAPFKSISAAVNAAKSGAIICIAEGTYAEQIKPGTKAFTLAGGFQKGKDFKVRDSAKYISKATGGGSGSFVLVEDPSPSALTAIDGFDISGYSQAIVRNASSVQPFEITNNHIHDNECEAGENVVVGGGFSLANVKGTVKGNVFKNNTCGRGGAGALTDSSKQSELTLANNLIDGNEGNEPESSHGGAIYLFGKKVTVTGNVFINNKVTGWGAGLYVGSDTSDNQKTTATLSWNVYRSNSAGVNGGGLFCDDGATCNGDHEIFDKNCGGNLYVDSAYSGGTATIGTFDHITNVNALEVGCGGPGFGFKSDRDNDSPDTYKITNSIFSGNAEGQDLVAGCSSNCEVMKITVSSSMVQTDYVNAGVEVTFGDGNVSPADPLFVDPSSGDFHLKSKNGHWTPTGFVKDTSSSPALGKGADGKELGAYGNSGEASK